MNQLKVERRNAQQLPPKVFNAAVDEGLIMVSPLKRAKIRRPAVDQIDIDPLTVAEIKQLAMAAEVGKVNRHTGKRDPRTAFALSKRFTRPLTASWPSVSQSLEPLPAEGEWLVRDEIQQQYGVPCWKIRDL